jgi:hypothetical protein
LIPKADIAALESSAAQRLTACLVHLSGIVGFWIPGLCAMFWWGRRYPFLLYQGRRAAVFQAVWFLVLAAVATSYALCAALIRHSGTVKILATGAHSYHWLYACQNILAAGQWLVPVAWLTSTLAMASWALIKTGRRLP